MLKGPVPAASGDDRWRFVRFLAVGVLNTAVGYGLYALFLAFGLAPELALLVATVFGVLFNFATTGRLVFRSRDNRLLLRFCAVYGVMYVLNAAALHGVLGPGVAPLLAQAMLLPVVVVVTYLAMRTFVFRGAAR